MEVKEFSNQKIEDVLKRKDYSKKISKFYERIEGEQGIKAVRHEYFEGGNLKSERLLQCMNYWESEIYHKHKTIELVRTFRCGDKFCSNCKKVRSSKSLAELLPYFSELSVKYKPYLLTLTVPNIAGESLFGSVDRLFKKFRTFIKYYMDKITSKNAYKSRKFSAVGALRSLEVTTNDRDQTYHPHLHVLLFIETDNLEQFEKTIKGEYDNKTRQRNLISSADIEIRELWTMLYNDVSRWKSEINTEKFNPDAYMCDIRPIDGIKGILEVVKYSFKSSDIKSFNDFYYINSALHGKRLKQGYGELYNLKLEDDEDKIDRDSPLFEDELPQSAMMSLKWLLGEKYANYTKVTRFKPLTLIDIVKNEIPD